MKTTLRLPAIAFMALPLFANAQTDTLSKTDTTQLSSSAKKLDYLEAVRITKESYLYFTPEYNFTKMVDGQTSGLQTTNGGGQPGASADMVIRGMSNLSGNTAPLIILDGMPYYGDYASINKSDINSMTILKDAAAGFEFGNRGSNGIITITTKSALIGAKNTHKEKLEVTAQFGISTPELPAYKTLDTKQYFETLNSAIQNAGLNSNVVDFTGGYNPYNVPKEQLIGSDGKLNPNAQLKYYDNWRDEMSRAGIRQNYNVATSASGKMGAYYLSVGYLNDKGYVQQTDYERFSTRFNSHLNITQWLKLGVRSQATIANQHFADESNTSVFRASQLIAPVYPVYYRNTNGDKETDATIGMNKFDWGNLTQYPNSSMGDSRYAYGMNSIGSLYLDHNSSKTNTFILNPYVSASFLKHLEYTADFNYNLNKDNMDQDYSALYGKFASNGGATNKLSNDLTQLNFRQKLVWDQQWNDHHLNVSLHNDYIKQNTKYNSEFNYPGGAPSLQYLKNQYHMLSYYTMANYDYKDKYIVSAGIRKDQTSLADYKWETNWFVGAAYRISNENFLKYSGWINDLKLKVNYGTQGHSILTSTHFNYPSPPTTSTSVLPNNQISGGIESSMFVGKLSFGVTAYNRNSASNISIPAPPSTGLPPIVDQMKFNNKGLELYVYGTIIQHRNLKWNTIFMWTHNTNKIVSMPSSTDSWVSGNYLYKKGNSVADFYLVEYAGVDKNNGKALYYTIDNNGNKTTTSDYVLAYSNDRTNQGSALPKMYGSLTNSFEFKQFELSFQVNYSVGGKYYDQTYSDLMGNGFWGNNWSTDILNAWTPSNNNSNIPIVEWGGLNTGFPSTRFLKDASYLSFANAYLGYSFNYEKVKKLKMQSLRIYASANNLFMIAGRRGMNPQADFYNSPGYVYAPARTIVLGLKVGI